MKIVSIDIGGTTIKTSLIDTNGYIILKFSTIPTLANDGIIAIKKSIRNAINRYWQESDKTHLAISSAGTIDSDTGDVIFATNTLPGYTGFRISSELSREYNCRCVAINDASAALIGECFFGAGKDYSRVMMLTLGTGLGVSLLQNKKELTSQDVVNLDVAAHYCLYDNGYSCGCGKKGCAEQYVSATALKREYKDKNLDKLFSSSGSREKSIKQKFFNDFTNVLKRNIEEYNPNVFIIGGGVIETAKYWWNDFRLQYFQKCKTPIEKACLRNKAGVIGAAYNCLNGKYLYQ